MAGVSKAQGFVPGGQRTEWRVEYPPRVSLPPGEAAQVRRVDSYEVTHEDGTVTKHELRVLVDALPAVDASGGER